MLLYCYFFLLVALVSAAKDFYKLLGVGKSATDAEIKRAFRKLALKYHPDRNQEKDAEAKFREIAEAYEILSDANKRRQYDQFGDAAFSQNGGDGFSGGHGFNFDFDSFFKKFDESFNMHRRGAGDGNTKFGFDDLWGDDDELFRHHFGNSRGEQRGGNMFDFDLGDMFGENSFFGGDAHAKIHRSFHQTAHASSHASHGGQAGQSCRTVTQRFGNTVTTFTQCN